MYQTNIKIKTYGLCFKTVKMGYVRSRSGVGCSSSTVGLMRLDMRHDRQMIVKGIISVSPQRNLIAIIIINIYIYYITCSS